MGESRPGNIRARDAEITVFLKLTASCFIYLACVTSYDQAIKAQLDIFLEQISFCCRSVDMAEYVGVQR